MNRLTGKFRERWRSYLPWAISAAFIACTVTIPLVWLDLSKAEANRKHVPELRKLAEQIPIYPGFQKDSENVVLKRSRASFYTNYKSNAQFSEVKKFYDNVLGERGWRLSELTGISVYYRRGDYEIFVGENDSGGWYSVIFIWEPE
jgi:hypothetical protein